MRESLEGRFEEVLGGETYVAMGSEHGLHDISCERSAVVANGPEHGAATARDSNGVLSPAMG